MNATEVRAALKNRWPDSEYLHIAEAPEGSDRQGRKIDVLVLSLWKSRGHELDAVEIKVSRSDWTRERQHAAKADFWWRHAHRFWLAVPVDLAPKIRDEIPTTWGLLACSADATKVVVKPERHTREPLTWQTTVGLLRAAADAGPNALLAARDRGAAEGFERGKRAGALSTSAGAQDHELTRLRGLVAQFHAATGVDLASGHVDADRVARGMALAGSWDTDPARVAHVLDSTARYLATAQKTLAELTAQLAEHGIRP